MRKTTHIAVVFVCLAALVVPLHSQSGESEMENLRKRIRELEDQNQGILKTLEELKARIAGQPQAPAPASAALPAPASQATSQKPDDQPVQWPELVTGGNRLKFYGFLRLDMVTDSTRPDSSQSAFYILSEDPRAGGAHAQNFTLYPRLTRFGINFAGPAVPSLGNSKLSGRLEIDFNNGGRESRPIPRFRHAYFKLTHGTFFLLAGQTFDLMSPLMPTPNTDTLMWNAGNLGDRRPQLQAVYEPRAGGGQFYYGASAALTGAIDGQDLDNNGFRDGEESGLPTLQGRVGYTHALGSRGLKAGIGVSGHRGWEYTTKAVAGRHSFYSQSTGVDYTLSLAESLMLRGEAWFGRNLSDVRGASGRESTRQPARQYEAAAGGRS
jgi:hypothetical protein